MEDSIKTIDRENHSKQPNRKGGARVSLTAHVVDEGPEDKPAVLRSAITPRIMTVQIKKRIRHTPPINSSITSSLLA
jgi:hypothetical protein